MIFLVLVCWWAETRILFQLIDKEDVSLHVADQAKYGSGVTS